jgi:L-ascorbate metabolism protein UlaG (beta-lactamase superfamily)
MMVDNININTQSSIRMVLNIVIYFDPFLILDDTHDADIIFITHAHYDHYDLNSINKVKNENTIIVAPKSMKMTIEETKVKDYILLDPFEEIDVNGINVKTVPAYNISKTFHPKDYSWLGYLVTYNNITYYIAGDTDNVPEIMKIKCDVALIPIGGTFTMDYMEANKLVRSINPKIVIPTHYGSIVGNIDAGKKLRNNLYDITNVIEKW